MDTMSNKFDFILQCNRLSWASNEIYAEDLIPRGSMANEVEGSKSVIDCCYHLITTNTISNKKPLGKFMDTAQENLLMERKSGMIGGTSLIFQSRHYPDFPQHI